MTNEDKIRTMDSEELAAVLMEPCSREEIKAMSDKKLAAVIKCPYKKNMCLLDEADMRGDGTPPTEENCNRCALAWLKSEAVRELHKT